MKVETKTIKIFIADDGKEFFTQAECYEYDKKIKLKKDRQEFLSKVIIEEMKQIPNMVRVKSEKKRTKILNSIYVVAEDNFTEMGWIDEEDGGKWEFNENCPFEPAGFDTLVENIHVKYGYKIEDNISYWSK